ncbi:hypothetical protein SAMN05444354_101750 [Stigmatella aurantiaca]|uniref:DUF7305 domain-containing protein n=1 Tax=Stigmatella aurantiaca TaxID=41 RepID=A0A1H7HNE6_STIAU|nr:hypothetical protein [Stigmatella aurantiaca]SEK50992.1 hypothetical protein SAMN05444354_101750 [Stigmatella aurantiaca]
MRAGVWLLVGVLAGACTVRDPVAQVRDGEDASVPGEGEEDGGLPPPPPPEDWATYCQGSGPPVLVNGSGPSVCSGVLAQQAFTHAVCACEGLALSAPLRVDAFHGSQGPYTTGEKAGALGVNGDLTSDNVVDVGGAVSAGGLIRMGFSLSVGDSLHGGGALLGNGTFTVAKDAQVRGNVGVGSLTVGGRLTVPAGNTLTGTLQAAEVLRQPVEVPAPCGCAPTGALDIAGLVAHHAQENHNADIGLAPSALEGFTGSRRLELPCGRFYLDRISGEGGLTLVAQGRTALFVGGRVSLGDQLAVEVQGPGAELDLFIAGDVAVTGPLRLGSGTKLPRMRVYIAGPGTLTVEVDSALTGHLYAPQVLLRLSGNADVFGSVLVRRVEASSTALFHHDLDVLHAADACVSSSTR